MQTTFKLTIFFVASVGIFRVSRSSMHSRHFHGFYRFFAWEAIVALFLLNPDHWFHKPSRLHQEIALTCVGISSLLAIHGFQLLRKVGKPDAHRAEPALLWIERTTVLVTVGAYKYVRHPLYCSLLFLTWAVLLNFPSWPGATLAAVATVSLIAAAKVEERENLHFFGAAYGEYMKRTKMFIPFII